MPVVLLHGFGLDHRMWDDQARALAEKFLVIRYDMRGFGRSSLPAAEPYAHADDLYTLLSSLSARPAHVVGLSCALDGHLWSAEWHKLWSLIDSTAKTGDIAAARRLWLEHPLFAPAREQAGVAARLSEIVSDYSGWHWVHSDPVVASRPAAIKRLDAIRAATLIVLGERDLPDFHRVADTLASGIHGAASVVIPRAGHMANMEAPAKFNSILLDFLETWRGTGRVDVWS
jgi:pimeloyl-ACP methyl ester carboxylesterase